MRNKTRRNAADIAGRGGQRRPAPAQLPSPKETAFDAEAARFMRMGQFAAPPAPAPQGPATPLVGGYAKGGKVRGCGVAQRGLTKGTIR